jgi:hypothetical protein
MWPGAALPAAIGPSVPLTGSPKYLATLVAC